MAKKKEEMLLIGSKTKSALKGKGKFNVSTDALEGLNRHGHWLLAEAQPRAKANGRKTIRKYDILAGC